MIMIRQRMQHAKISCQPLNMVFVCFRPKRSKYHAIYIIRPLQDYAEVQGTQLY